ncbi:MAG: hypothetical protein BWY73_01364 [candidate division TA06 bacterium ADurb.Bin417]|uniref:Uncharacterized protein n=1 Tax=candidate division TA06 bacterium ADurb.Bin417 TaxID=1852828 RepID=A0A1V5MAR7_UNCT6|nr:MAG: hypothetical protein BWY73_01364 [candidate division TA06 bacterium ADurb.Bin417]
MDRRQGPVRQDAFQLQPGLKQPPVPDRERPGRPLAAAPGPLPFGFVFQVSPADQAPPDRQGRVSPPGVAGITGDLPETPLRLGVPAPVEAGGGPLVLAVLLEERVGDGPVQVRIEEAARGASEDLVLPFEPEAQFRFREDLFTLGQGADGHGKGVGQVILVGGVILAFGPDPEFNASVRNRFAGGQPVGRIGRRLNRRGRERFQRPAAGKPPVGLVKRRNTPGGRDDSRGIGRKSPVVPVGGAGLGDVFGRVKVIGEEGAAGRCPGGRQPENQEQQKTRLRARNFHGDSASFRWRRMFSRARERSSPVQGRGLKR